MFGEEEKPEGDQRSKKDEALERNSEYPGKEQPPARLRARGEGEAKRMNSNVEPWLRMRKNEGYHALP